jgi:hypothetical protein
MHTLAPRCEKNKQIAQMISSDKPALGLSSAQRNSTNNKDRDKSFYRYYIFTDVDEAT